MEYKKLSEIASIHTGGTPSRKNKYFWDNGNIPWIKISDIKNKYVTYSSEFITDEGLKNSTAKILKKGTILYTIFATIGEVAILNINASTNQAIVGIDIFDPNIINEYLYYYLSYIKKDVINISRGVAQNNINLTILKNLEIPIIKTEFQEKIINNLNKLESIIEKRKKQLDFFDKLIKFRFIERFGSPIVNEFNFEVKKIRDIVIEVKYGTSKPAQKTGDYEYIRMNNITNDGYLDLSDIKYISLPENEIEKYLVKKGDILFNRTNSIDLVGKTAIFNFEKPMVIAGYIIRIRINEKYMLPLYLSTFMNLKSTKKILKNLSKGAVNQANINAKELQNIEIPLPPLSLQNEFADFVREVDKSKFVNINNSIKLLKSVQNNVFCQRKKFYNVDNIYEYDGKECRI